MIDFADLDSCWEWKHAHTLPGYGQVKIGGQHRYVHRIMARLVFHDHVPPRMWDNLCVLHKCDNPSCFNPSHLFLGTQADNIADAMSKGRMATTSGAKLNGLQIRIIRRLLGSGNLYQKEIAEVFGVTQSNISVIKCDKSWRNANVQV